MNILTPISSVDEVKAFSEAGANEFYIGYTDELWVRNFNGPLNEKGTIFMPLNGRTRMNANISSWEELRRIIHLADQLYGRLYVTVNAPFYTENMYQYLIEFLRKLESIGVRRLIVSDIGLMELLCREFPGFKLTVSCITQTVSSWQVQFFKHFAVERIVFPRHTPVSDVCEIATQHPDLEFECFGLCEKCMHGDGFCRSLHGIGTFCKDCWDGVYESVTGSEISKEKKRAISDNQKAYRQWISPETAKDTLIDNFGCSLCAVGNMMQYENIKAIKLSGRGRSSEFVKVQIQAAKEVIRMFEMNQGIKIVQKYIQQTLGPQYCADYAYCVMRGIGL